MTATAPTTPHRRAMATAIAIVLALVAAACGSDTDTAVAGPEVATAEPTTEPVVTASPPPVTPAAEPSQPEPSTPEPSTPEPSTPEPATPAPPTPAATSPTTGEVERELPPFPSHTDPCAEEVNVGTAEYSIIVAGQERPVSVEWTEAASGDDPPLMIVAFHVAGDAGVDVEPTVAATGAGLVVRPRASADTAPFWSESPGFNVDYVETLFDALDEALCFDEDRISFFGQHQGSLVVAEAVCSTNIPMAVATLIIGLVSPLECTPPRPVPIMSLNIFEFNPITGFHWDGKWNPPAALEAEVTGGIGPVPEDLDEWAAVYGCEDQRHEEAVPDPDDVLERDSVLFSYVDCDAPIYAWGVQQSPGSFGPDLRALAGVAGPFSAIGVSLVGGA